MALPPDLVRCHRTKFARRKLPTFTRAAAQAQHLLIVRLDAPASLLWSSRALPLDACFAHYCSTPVSRIPAARRRCRACRFPAPLSSSSPRAATERRAPSSSSFVATIGHVPCESPLLLEDGEVPCTRSPAGGRLAKLLLDPWRGCRHVHCILI